MVILNKEEFSLAKDSFEKKLNSIKLPKVIEIVQVGNIRCAPCNICNMGFSHIQYLFPDKFKFTYLDIEDYRNNPEYAKYKIDYMYIPKLYLMINKKPIFVGNSELANSSTNVINDIYLHLMGEDSTTIKLLYDDLVTKLKSDKLKYKNIK